MICRGPWKLVADRGDMPGDLTPTMLFNIAEDPYEMGDLVNAPGATVVRDELLAALAGWDSQTRSSSP